MQLGFFFRKGPDRPKTADFCVGIVRAAFANGDVPASGDRRTLALASAITAVFSGPNKNAAKSSKLKEFAPDELASTKLAS